MQDEDKTLYPVLFKGDDGVFSITAKEKDFLDYFIQTKDLSHAAKKAGLTPKAAKEFLRGKRIRPYIASRIKEIASKNDVTLDSLLHRLHQVAFGKLIVTKQEMDALKVLSHYVGIIKPPQTNIGVKVSVTTNPLKEKSDSDLDAMITHRSIEVTGVEPNA